MSSLRPQVVIVGSGFGGMAAARTLADAPVDVTVVDQHNFHTFLPLLYQVATAGLNPADVAYPARAVYHRQDNLRFHRGRVVGVDWDRRVVEVDADGDGVGDELALRFDHLIVAAGASAAFFGIPGAEQHGFPLYTLDDAVAVRNHVLDRFEAADVDPKLIDDGALTFTVVGGGPTGVEVAGALAELFDHVLRKDFPHLDFRRPRIVLVEMAPALLTPFAASSQRHALDTLTARGVEVRLGEAVTTVTPTRVELRSGEVVPCHTLVWAAGVQANPLAAALDVPTGRAGRIVVGPDLRIAQRPGAFAVGDVAAIPTGKGDAVHPQLAQVAIQSGRHAAREILLELKGDRSKAFKYRNKGIMATVGRRSAVTELPGGLKLRGTLAWVSWLFLHLLYLVGFRNRASVLVNWGWNYLTYDRGPRLILGPGRPPRPGAAPPDPSRGEPGSAGPEGADDGG